MEYVLHILMLIVIYSVLAYSLDFIVGHGGLVSLAQAGFFGIGAYAAALLSLKFGLSLPTVFLASICLTALMSLFVSVPSFYLQDDYFVVVTFCFQMIVFSIFNNWLEVTRGALGIPGIPLPVLFGWEISSKSEFIVLGLLILAFSALCIWGLTRGAFGRILHGLREDEVYTESLGWNVRAVKIIAFAVSAVLAGLAGSLYGFYVAYIDPTYFTVMESILILSIVIVGGAGSFAGPVIGASVLVLMPEALRFIGFTPSLAGNMRELVYGLLLVLILLFRPQGIAGKYDFTQSKGAR
ncbi:MAG: branched-chain amino acid ABC transporter permease [Rhodospirillales bacterium]|nr:branched-chain amino acid ABC transporter permease [Rhodospirillales bacterium]